MFNDNLLILVVILLCVVLWFGQPYLFCGLTMVTYENIWFVVRTTVSFETALIVCNLTFKWLVFVDKEEYHVRSVWFNFRKDVFVTNSPDFAQICMNQENLRNNELCTRFCKKWLKMKSWGVTTNLSLSIAFQLVIKTFGLPCQTSVRNHLHRMP